MYHETYPYEACSTEPLITSHTLVYIPTVKRIFYANDYKTYLLNTDQM